MNEIPKNWNVAKNSSVMLKDVAFTINQCTLFQKF